LLPCPTPAAFGAAPIPSPHSSMRYPQRNSLRFLRRNYESRQPGMYEHGFHKNSGGSSCFDESAWWWIGDLCERLRDVAAISIASKLWLPTDSASSRITLGGFWTG